MTEPEMPRYWFPAKRYGWGWGLPRTWQGWVVILVYLLFVLGGIPLVRARAGAETYGLYFALLTVALVVVCFLKGEPPRRRWGDRDR